MTEVFDMNMNDLLGEDSEFIKNLQGALEAIGYDIDEHALVAILHEYELVKMDFLKAHIMQLLEHRGDEFKDGPVKVVVSQSGVELEPIEQDDDPIDTSIIS